MRNETLTSLNLEDNHLQAEGAKHMAEALLVNKTLTNINLADNCICLGGEMSGLLALCETLKINSSLRELNLRDNNLGPIGAAHVADALKSNSSLRELNLLKNFIVDESQLKQAARTELKLQL